METKNMIGKVVGITVALICVAVILMPVLSDATATEKTFTNEGVFNYGVFGTTDTYTLEFDATDGSIVVNDTTVTPISIVTGTSGSCSVVSADNFLLRYGSNSSGYYMQIIGVDSDDASLIISAATATATISDSLFSITYTTSSSSTEVTKTFEFTEVYAIVADTDEAVMKSSSSEVYILGDSELYASGLTTVSAWSNMFHFEGTYDDGITITSPNLTDATFDNIEWNIEEVDGYEDLYKLTSVEFDITYDDTTVHATYSYFAVPTEVTAELSQHLSAGEIAIVGAIPVMMIVAIVLMSVGIITSKRD